MTCPSPLALDRYWLAGAPPDHAVHAHVAGCAACARHLAACDDAARGFEARVLPTLPAPRSARPAPWPRWWERAWGRAVARRWVLAGGLATVVLAVVLGLGRVPSDPARDAVSFKGALGLEVVASRQGAEFRVHDEDLLQPGDRLRFRVTTPRPGYVLVVSVEDGGRVTRFYPFEGDTALAVDGRGTWLGGSIALDGFAGYERVYVVFSPRPFALADVREPAAALAARPGAVQRVRALPVPFDQASLAFRKLAATAPGGEVQP